MDPFSSALAFLFFGFIALVLLVIACEIVSPGYISDDRIGTILQFSAPLAFLAGLLQIRLARASVATLVVELLSANGLRELQDAIAETLGASNDSEAIGRLRALSARPLDMRATIASTGLPGIRRMRRKLASKATANATRNQRNLFSR